MFPLKMGAYTPEIAHMAEAVKNSGGKVDRATVENGRTQVRSRENEPGIEENAIMHSGRFTDPSPRYSTPKRIEWLCR